jgi:anti-sigma B factor antagonist
MKRDRSDLILSKEPATDGPPLVGVTRRGPGVGKTVVWLRGEHDISSAHSLAAAIASAAAVDDTDIALDLSGVEFMDSTTIHVIERARTSIGTDGRAFTVRDPSRFARFVLGLCGLDYLVEP